GEHGYDGDGGPATQAKLRAPRGMATDSAGNFYFADQTSRRVRKISSAGVITTFAGNGASGYSGDGGPAASAQLNDPTERRSPQLRRVFSPPTPMVRESRPRLY
ncbi:MAG: hypothetical protein ACREAB_04795, partial [Blastocatellia bacterium]